MCVLSSDLSKWKEKNHPRVVFRLKQMGKKTSVCCLETKVNGKQHPCVVFTLK